MGLHLTERTLQNEMAPIHLLRSICPACSDRLPSRYLSASFSRRRCVGRAFMPGWRMHWQSVATGTAACALLSLPPFRQFLAGPAGSTREKKARSEGALEFCNGIIHVRAVYGKVTHCVMSQCRVVRFR